jgi:phospholipid/cholesterol/gamma-HCH transport system substrate-binding protein
MTYNRLIGVGIFVLGGILLFSLGLFLIGSRRMFFADKFEVYTAFSRVTGLEAGAKVRVAGMDAGQVEEIAVPRGPAERFHIRMRLREDLHPLVRTDSVASIQTDGLVGNRFVQIDKGSERHPPTPPGFTIPGREPFDIGDLLDQASQTVRNMDRLVNQLGTQLEGTLTEVTKTVSNANALVDDVGREVRVITADGRRVTQDVSLVVESLRAGHGTIGKLLNDDEFYRRATNIATEVEKTLTNVRETVDRAKATLGTIEDGTPGIGNELRQTVALARETMADLADNAEALKQHFLFRGYFNRRGWFDLDSLSPTDYRRGALGSEREVIRVWLGADRLFDTRANDGTEVLSPEGRRRIDSAMATFLRYPRSVPLIIEGYAEGPTQEARFTRSRDRAMLVREYVVGRFGRSPNTTGAIAMGLEAVESPRGDGHWNGIGLALWVPHDAFAKPRSAARIQGEP